MKIIHYKPRLRTNASLISMVQRFSDVFIIFTGLYLVCYFNGLKFGHSGIFLSLVILTVFQMIGGITDFYRSWRGVKFSAELSLISKNWTLSMILTTGVLSLFSELDVYFTLKVISQWFIVVCIGFLTFRILIRFMFGVLRKLGYNRCRVALAGSLPVGINLVQSFKEQPWLGFVVEGIYDDTNFLDIDGIDYLGDFTALVSDARAGKLDRIYLAMSMGDEAKIKKIVRELQDSTCSVMFIPDVFTFSILQSRTEEVNGVPVVPLFDTPLNGINMILKRLEDIIVSSLIITFISHVLLIISCAVKLTSPGPVIFKQTRYGIDGRPIVVWKFRTMNVMENDTNVQQATKNDIRITKLGRFLRSTSLDELPQFFNVFIGDMSIVGPRPHAVAHNEQYRSLIEGYMLRHKVKPGITGWAQINGWRGETDTLEKMKKRVEYDLEYIREWSILFDVKIIFLTIFKGFIGKAAY
ncbi:undecaprenyl-phosphate glucose phosphotransferase [Klebsiella aerogenes]|uniref:undecaprenyl-phosphate glucose phosphotransferase n=1 Tax=Klebsiella aerogenes TaxID=548 RepID=UPI00388F77B9